MTINRQHIPEPVDALPLRCDQTVRHSSVNPYLTEEWRTLGTHSFSHGADARVLHTYRAVDFIRGGGSYACPRSGCLLACPLQPDRSRREGSLVKSTVALVAWSRTAARAEPSFSRQPTGVWRRRCGSASGSCGERAVLAARAAPAGRLESVQKVLTSRLGKAGQAGQRDGERS